MRNALPSSQPWRNESAIVNLDSFDGPGTHWVAYYKRGRNVHYFDSYGNLKPPRELITYFGGDSRILYNYTNFQKLNKYNCGHLCLEFLYNKNQI